VLVIGIAASLALAGPVLAQAPDDEIQMDPAPAEPGSGSGSGSGSDAQAPVKDPKLAKKLLYAAQQLVMKGDYYTRAKRPDDAKPQYDQAVVAFQKSIELGDDVNVYFELALVEDKLGKFDEATKHLRVVTTATAGVRPDVAKKATAKLDEESAKIGIVTLTINPEGATVSLNGVELGKAPLPGPLILLPGTYTVAFQAEGFQPKEAELKVEAGSESERTIELEPVKIVIEPPKPREPEPEPPPPPPPSKLPLYVGGGTALGCVAVASVTGLMALTRHGTFVSKDATASERADAKSSGRLLAHVTDGMLLGAVAAGGFTTYWYFFKYKKALAKPPTEKNGAGKLDLSKLDVIPWVQPDAGGVFAAGSF